MKNIEKAVEIAKKNLRECYAEKGIFAGLHHFKDYWARDSCFASYGSLAIRDYDIVRKNLSNYLDHINEEWQLPRKIAKHRLNIDLSSQIPLKVGASHFGIVMKYLGVEWKRKRKPYYTTDKNKHKTVDQNSLIVISSHEYVKETGDIGFLKKYVIRIEKALLWNYSCDHDTDLIIEQKHYSDWADSMKKEGKVLYTNICHCHALKCLSDMFMMLEMKKKHLKYLSLYNRTKEKIEKVFWNGRYYTDWIHDERREHFSTDGNMLAVVWDIAPEKHSIPIAEYSKKHGIDKVPSACVYPLYPKKMTAPLLSMLGLSDYHNGLSWLWLGCASALAKEKAGLEKEAVEILNTIADMIVDYGIVYEIYDNKGKPVKRPLYKAEYPFAWSSGMFLYAVRKILKKPI